MSFNGNGQLFAYALSYDWSKGHEGKKPDMKPQLFVHRLKDEDIKPRQKKK